MRTQVSPSGKVFTRAEVPENEPVRVHSPSTVQSTQPSEKISSDRRAVIWYTVKGFTWSATAGMPSMEATKRASSGVEPIQAPAPDSPWMSLPP